MGWARGKVTLADVAARAGVSVSTASMAFLGGRSKTIKVGAVTRERIRKAAEELRYVPNNAARNLALRKSGFIGYLVTDILEEGLGNALSVRYMAGVEDACRRHGYGLYVARAELSDIKKVVFPERLRQQSVDGIVAYGAISDAVYEEFERYHLPTVFLNRNRHTENRYATFCVDFMDGLRLAVERAYELGHRRVWLCRLCEPELARQIRKLIGKLTATRKDLTVGLTDYLEAPYDIERHADILLSKWHGTPEPKRPTFLAGDSRTLARLLGRLQPAGLCCPDDVSVMGVTDFEFNQYTNPRLSCVDFYIESIGREATELVIRHIESGKIVSLDESRNDYPAHIIERESVRKVGH